MPLGPGNRTVDVWLDRGTHDLTIFAAVGQAVQGVGATRAREDHNAAQVVLSPFRAADFDLSQPHARPALPRGETLVRTDHGVWDFAFDAYELRHARVVIEEYLGEAVAINHMEIRGEDESELHIPTKADVLSLAGNDMLEIAAGDLITASYTDEFTQSAAGRSQLLTSTLTATYFNSTVAPIAYDFVRQPNGAVQTRRKRLMRIDPGERLIVEVTDYDQDTSGEPDEITIQVAVNDGEPLKLVAKETGPYTGIFTKEVDTSESPAEGKLAVQRGDQIYCSYIDAQNTFPGHAVARESIVYVNQPSEGRLRIVETRLVRPQQAEARPQAIYLPPPQTPKELSNVAFEVPLTVEVFDRDAAKDDRSSVTVRLQTTDGAKLDVRCVVSDAFYGTTAGPVRANPGSEGGLEWALEEGRFIGQVILQLGSRHSADLVPLTASMPRNLVGGPVLEEEQSSGSEGLITRVLNLTGKDLIQAVYTDELRPGGSPLDLAGKGRLIAGGVLACTDRDYEKPLEQLHVGEKMFLMVTDADLDVSDERDRAAVEITTQRGEREVVSLEETLAHSGVFTGSITLKPAESPTAGNLSADDPAVETYFGDLVKLKYTDKAASTETGELDLELEVPVVVGTDGLVAAFSKTFNDEKLAVETQFHIAESYFELFKSHKKLERPDDLRLDLEAGRRVLREVMEDYPDPKYVPRIAYLLGQFAQELGQWAEAIDSYQMIVRQYADHTLAADAQYKLAQCYEESGDFDAALEAYVTLAATYPNSPLIANVMLRISERFYRDERFDVAAQVGEKFLERFEGHEWGPRMAFRIGQCYYKAQEYRRASDAFDRFVKLFPDDALAADALFWSGESFRLGNNNQVAFQRYNRCRWDFPASDAAKYSRGRLALPAMLAEFERAANVEP
jgi:TolA-binding protein